MNQLVGRQQELEAISAKLTAVHTGRGGTLFLSGEPGIGKSALARQLAEQADDLSLSVYWGFCWEAGGAPAYWPWTQSLRSLVSDRTVEPEQLAKLGQLLPESAGEDTQPELQPDQARFQLLEATRTLLDEITRKQPVVLVVEDLHAADTDSLPLLQYLARHAGTMPLLLVGTYRELEARQSPTTDPLWQATRDAQVLQLSRLDEDSVREFLESGSGGHADSERVRDLFNTTEGNPLFLNELVGLLEQTGDEKLPETVQQVIRQQIELLPEATASALAEAAVLGREFFVAALSALRNQDDAATERELEAALATGLIHTVQPGRYRFSHVLHRDVLYQGLGTTRRQELHVRFARYIRQLIDAGDEDRWSVCATHLQAAGSDYRTDAIAAWEANAARAHKRLAFDDAAGSLQNALLIFGDGPKFDPAKRCALEIHCAQALMLVGDIETARAHCRNAFATSRTLGDTQLMAEAALTYGNAIVVGNVDKEHIALLQECLATVPADDAATRARVQARLAAAMQPAVDPVGPMEMARDAIELARSTDDEATLFAVLRYAISALMDFMAPNERIPLNREFEALAAKRGNVAGQFRSNLRLMVDAFDLGDRQMLDDAIDAAEHISKRIDLPHYQWRVTSARAMQFMIDGEFARAMDLIDQAEQLAERVNDLEAKLTLPVQRFSVLCDWDSGDATPLRAIRAQLDDAYESGMGASRFFIEPFIAAFSLSDSGTQSVQILENDAIIERTFSGGDRFSMAMVGELAIAAGKTALAKRAYEALLQYSDGCVTLGLMGSCWCGPVSYTLGQIAAGLGDNAAASKHLEVALQISRRMRAQPVIARVLLAQSELAASDGNSSRAAELKTQAEKITRALSLRAVPGAPADEQPSAPAEPATAAEFEIQLDGDIRIIRYGDASVSLKDNKGLQILARLIAKPDEDLHVLDLAGTPVAPDTGDSGPQLDDKARDEYRRRVADLKEELQEAETLGDTGRVDALRDELDFITRELSRAFGLGGRERRSGNAAERARVNVRRRLKDAIERIGEQLPEAGRYLDNTIKTGSYCRYTPM